MNSSLTPQKVKNVELLGYNDKLKWTQDDKGLTVQMPDRKPCDYAVAFRILFA
jgi:alpha-L-fucosidase